LNTWQLNGLPGTSSPLNRKSTVCIIGSRGVNEIAYVWGPCACAEVGTRPLFTVTSKFPGPAWLVSTMDEKVELTNTETRSDVRKVKTYPRKLLVFQWYLALHPLLLLRRHHILYSWTDCRLLEHFDDSPIFGVHRRLLA